MKEDDDWLYEINSKQRLIDIGLSDILRYKDLLFLFVRRDIVATYKQTILGPIWYLLEPLFTSIIFTLIFNNIASITTGAVPPFLFNLAGVTLWNYFRECFTDSSNTFTTNSNLFSKVYFPRVIVPLSKSISSLFKLGIQLFLFALFYVYYIFKGAALRPDIMIWLIPVLILMMAVLGLGMGMIISSLTTKYRDFKILVSFAVSLLMYISAVMYPLSEVRNNASLKAYAWIVEYNPIAIVIESFRYITLGEGIINWISILYSFIASITLFIMGVIFFNKTGKSFIDTV
ncbi:ABC transporter permease [Leeuwenhoekiella sp. A16]|uniref:ABC transporter permease n=1 Tax=Leeuwenhoekiella sp. A16 TaxID=3141462 RepID=UPI003A80F535